MSTTPLGTTGDTGGHDLDAVHPGRAHASSHATHAMTPPREVRIGPYRLAERLGEGGMGVVHLGIDERGRAVAVKVLRDHVAQDPSARTRLAREFDTLQRVRHELVAPVLDADIDGEHPYLVTRYVPGPPLDVWVRDHGPLGRAELVRLGRGLAQALGAIHDAGVVHRDLKPGNVLMLDGDPVVIDFGIAHVADDVRLTSTGLVMGTPGYLPPELLDGADVDEATDWWGWAATMAYAGTGRDPFGRGPLDAIFHRVYRGDADLRGLDPAMARLLTRAFDPDPTRRPGLAAILDALEDIRLGRDDVPVAAPTMPVGRPVERPVEAPLEGARAPHADDAGGTATTATTAMGPPPEPATRPQPLVATRTMPRSEAPPPQHAWSYAGFRDASAAPPGGSPSQVGGDPRPDAASGAGLPGAVAPGESGEPGQGAHVASLGHVPRRPRRPVGAALVALLAFIVALAASMPVVAVLVALGWSILARSVHASTLSVLMRREIHGRRGSDVPRALLVWPLRLLPATLTTLLVALFTGIAAVLAAFATAAVQQTTYGAANGPLGDLPLAVAMLVGVLLGWWGPAGTALRHGSRVLVRSTAPGRWGVPVVAGLLWLAAAYFALRSQATGVGVQWWPLPHDLFSRSQLGL